jgi:hypothetical protein
MNATREKLVEEITALLRFASEELASLKMHRQVLSTLDSVVRKARIAVDGTDQKKRESAVEVLLYQQKVIASIEGAKNLYEQAGRMLDGIMKIAIGRTANELSNTSEIVELVEIQAQIDVAHKLVEAGAVFIVQIREYALRIRQSQKWVW